MGYTYLYINKGYNTVSLYSFKTMKLKFNTRLTLYIFFLKEKLFLELS